MASFITQNLRLSLNQLKLECYIGAYPHEFDRKQSISMDIMVEVKRDYLPHHDELAEVFNYDWLRDKAIEIASAKHYHLLETLCQDILAAICTRAEILSANVKICKLGVYPQCQAVCCEMSAYLES